MPIIEWNKSGRMYCYNKPESVFVNLVGGLDRLRNTVVVFTDALAIRPTSRLKVLASETLCTNNAKSLFIKCNDTVRTD